MRLTDGKFGKALDGRAGGAFVAGRDEFRQFPMTVECWTKLTDKGPFNILVAHELKSSGTHWELFSMAGSGNFTVYTPGFASRSLSFRTAMICDGKWHHVAMVLEAERIRLFVDGRQVAVQAHQRNAIKSVPGDLALASLVDKQIGCTGLLDEVRISRGIRNRFDPIPDKAISIVDDATIALWHLDELVEQKQFDDATKQSPAHCGSGSSGRVPVARQERRSKDIGVKTLWGSAGPRMIHATIDLDRWIPVHSSAVRSPVQGGSFSKESLFALAISGRRRFVTTRN